MALPLEIRRHVGRHAQAVREGRWAKSRDCRFWDFPLVELDGLTVDVMGLGRLGSAAVKTAPGLTVLADEARPTARRRATRPL
ncbi:MAG: hypothetical protein LBU12_03280 [Deltaproteobacteria bacterium]|nr:hypothetical protein [Deltaproteobacteria bacterium]